MRGEKDLLLTKTMAKPVDEFPGMAIGLHASQGRLISYLSVLDAGKRVVLICERALVIEVPLRD